MPPFGERAKAASARSITPASLTLSGVNSTPSDGATDWMAPSCPLPEAKPRSRRIAARITLGESSLSSSSHFPLKLYSIRENPVMLPPGCAKLSTNPLLTGSFTPREHDRHAAGRLLQCRRTRVAGGQDDVGRGGKQFGRFPSNALGIAGAPTIVDPQIAADAPAEIRQPLRERCDARRRFRIVRGEVHEQADAPNAFALLRPRRERPRCRRAAERG